MFVMLTDFFTSVMTCNNEDEIKQKCAYQDAGAGFAENSIKKKDDSWKDWPSNDIPAGGRKISFEDGNVAQIVCAIVSDNESDRKEDYDERNEDEWKPS